MTDVPVSTLVTEGTPVVTDISPGATVGMGMGKICGGSAENVKVCVAIYNIWLIISYNVAIHTYIKVHL